MGEGRTEEKKKKKKGINCTISSRVLLLLLLNISGDQISRKIYPLRFAPLLPLPTDFSFSSWNKRQKVFWSFFWFCSGFSLLLLFQVVFDKPWDIFMRSPSTPLFLPFGSFLVVGGVTDILLFFQFWKKSGGWRQLTRDKKVIQEKISPKRNTFLFNSIPFLLFCNKFYRMAVAINKWRRAGFEKLASRCCCVAKQLTK